MSFSEWRLEVHCTKEKFLLEIDSSHSIQVYADKACPTESKEKITAAATARMPRYILIEADIKEEEGKSADEGHNRQFWVKVEDLKEAFGNHYPVEDLLSATPEERAARIYHWIHSSTEEMPAYAGCGASAVFEIVDIVAAAFKEPTEVEHIAEEVAILERFVKATKLKCSTLGKESKTKFPMKLALLTQLKKSIIENQNNASNCLHRLQSAFLTASEDQKEMIKFLISQTEGIIKELETSFQNVLNAIGGAKDGK